MRLQVKIELKGYYYIYCTTKINSKAFAIPILTYLINNYKLDAVKIGIANALELIFVVYIITLSSILACNLIYVTNLPAHLV